MSSLLGNFPKGLLFIVSAPAGTGKTTLVQMLTKEFPSIVASISFTTRNPRQGEVEGVHYHFITLEEFAKRIDEGDFLEYVELYGDFYGTSKTWVESQLNLGKHVILVIDTQGAKLLKDSKTVSIFIAPPSIEELARRLRSRQTDTKEAIEKRLLWAKREMEAQKNYDYLIINDNLSNAYEILRSILIAEEHRIR